MIEKNRLLPLVTWALALSPLLLLFEIISLALHVRMGLGHWPKPMIENYGTAAFDWHALTVIGFGVFTTYAAIPLGLLCLCFRPLRITRRTHLIQAGVFAAGWGVVWAYCAWDPQQFVAWYLD